ncbi:uncharacterized protein N7459_005459 [Penicillium hispanicum]|uniref:uncharacterized protein n=1 Tax=Penicillium hispanicum TaxID=1080232 RepID=UPI0025423FB1|nr:uncharacterized protein N7459_005459 [Penicillium hispanicum]KAJ5579474.1 hypothetical protein N7459_005459 [Penicillium hispanicum]
MAAESDHSAIQHLELKDFAFQNGVTLSTVRLAYRVFNPTGHKTALIPTCFRGRINETYNFTRGALQDYRVVVVALLGNGESSSPSNTPGFPATVDYPDCVRAQHQLVTEHLHLSSLDALVGFSMGGQCVYHWATMYPHMVPNAVIICSSARTSLHNYQFLEGPKAALSASIDFNSAFRAQNVVPRRGLHAFGRAYSAWLTSAEWFEQRLFERFGFQTVDEWADVMCGEHYEDWHPDDLLALLHMWQRADLGAATSSRNERVSIEEALGRLTSRILLLPCQTDQYFRWEASEKEAAHLRHGKLAVIPSIWGHMAGGGGNPDDAAWMNAQIAQFLR